MKKSFLFILITLLFSNIYVEAQSVKGVVKKLTGSFKIEGTWDYEGASVEFKSSNLLKKAGGKVAANRIENNLNEQLSKIGFQAGMTTFVFNDDGTFKNITNGTSIPGKYVFNKSSKELTLKYVNHIPIKVTVSGSNNNISLLFGANDFLSMITFIGSASGVSILQGLSSILNSYDGMMIGLELKKQE